MEAVVIITVLALAQYIFFGVQVGMSRGRLKVSAPATAGNHEYECLHRVHQNTLEQLIVFIPVLWIFAHSVSPQWAAGFGVVYLAGRFVYRFAYVKDPNGRTFGFTLTFLPSAIMAGWALTLAIKSYL